VRSSGGGKPAYVYELTREVEDLFPKAYEPALGRLLDVLAERFGPEESEALLRSVGRRLAEDKTAPADGTRARLEAAAGVLNELGGLAELEERDGTLVIRGNGWPPCRRSTPRYVAWPRLLSPRLRECLSGSTATVARGLAAASRWRQPMTLPKDSCACWGLSGTASDRSGGQVRPPRDAPRATPSQETTVNRPMSYSADLAI
jgi:hypothetical protein